jgi:hypothetical protein
LAEDGAVSDSGGWGGDACLQRRRTAEVDATLFSAHAADAIIGREGAPTYQGSYSGIFSDPDGHPWEVAHNPGWRPAHDGSVHLTDGLSIKCLQGQLAELRTE